MKTPYQIRIEALQGMLRLASRDHVDAITLNFRMAYMSEQQLADAINERFPALDSATQTSLLHWARQAAKNAAA